MGQGLSALVRIMAETHQSDTITESESRYRSLQAAVADYCYHVEVESGRIRRKVHGPHCAVVTGYSAEEYAADPLLWMAIVLEEDQTIIEQQIADVIYDRHPPVIEYRIRRKDGRVRWMCKTVVPYHDNQGTLIAYDGLLRDVTDRKQIEQDLRQSEERFRLIFEDDLTGDYLAAPDGTILLCNQAFADIFGFSSRDEAIGSQLANLFASPQSWPQFIQLLRENKSLERYERAGRHSDGTIRHVIESVLGSFNAQGELIRINGYVYDDTDSKIREARLLTRNVELEEIVSQRTQALRAKHEHLQAVWNSAFDAIATIDSQGQIETVNRAAEKMFGYSSVEMIGQNVSMLMPSPYSHEHDGYLRRFLATGEPRILNAPRQLVARRKDGSIFPIDLSVTQVDHSPYFTGIIRDITDRKQLQRHILEISSEEQRRIGRELHDGTGQELTGLSLIAGTLLDLVQAVPESNAGGEAVRQMSEVDFNRICNTIRKLNQKLAEANHHVHQLSHGIMPVQIDTEALHSSLEELANATNMPPAVYCDFDCPGPVVILDNSTATHLYRIAQEAVNNAIRHSHAGRICISLQQKGDELVLDVSDDGIGIDEAHSRIAMARKDHGMGLRTMRYRAGMIGGVLQVERRQTGGTRVKCALFQGKGRE